MCEKENRGLTINWTNIRAFDDFNGVYGAKAIEICPMLAKFKINIVHHYNSLFAEDMKENDAFGSYINKMKRDASGTFAEIIVNSSMCEALSLTHIELLAAIAHEVGHIMLFFHVQKDFYQGQAEEMKCDDFACEIGLKDPLISLLNKLITKGGYPLEQNERIQKRIEYIKLFE